MLNKHLLKNVTTAEDIKLPDDCDLSKIETGPFTEDEFKIAIRKLNRGKIQALTT